MAQTFHPRPTSQKHPENRPGTKSYRGFLRSMIGGNVERVGLHLRTTPRIEKKAVNIVNSESGYSGFIMQYGRRMPKLRARARFVLCFTGTHQEY